MKLFLPVVLVLAVVACEALPTTRQRTQKIPAVFSNKPVATSEEFRAVSHAWLEFVFKSEAVVWEAAKEIDGILSHVDHADVVKDVREMFYKAYDTILSHSLDVYNSLSPDDDIALTVVYVKFGLIDVFMNSYNANTKIEDFLNDNIPEVSSQIVAIDDRALDQIGILQGVLYAVLEEYDDYEA